MHICDKNFSYNYGKNIHQQKGKMTYGEMKHNIKIIFTSTKWQK